jgi:putative membrane protein (TIGR04086 family)
VVVHLCSLSDTAIKIVCQVAKVAAIILGAMLFLRESKGLFKGMLFGFLCVVFTFFIFGAMAGSLSFSLTFLLELVVGMVAGGLSGILAVNLKNRK